MTGLELILPAVIPGAIDALKSLLGGLGRRIGGLSVDDEIKLDASNIERLKALAVLDTPGGTPSQWVIDLRASFRYVAAGASVAIGGAVAYYVPSSLELAQQLIAVPFGFIFGERLYFGLKGIRK